MSHKPLQAVTIVKSEYEWLLVTLYVFQAQSVFFLIFSQTSTLWTWHSSILQLEMKRGWNHYTTFMACRLGYSVFKTLLHSCFKGRLWNILDIGRAYSLGMHFWMAMSQWGITNILRDEDRVGQVKWCFDVFRMCSADFAPTSMSKKPWSIAVAFCPRFCCCGPIWLCQRSIKINGFPAERLLLARFRGF